MDYTEVMGNSIVKGTGALAVTGGVAGFDAPVLLVGAAVAVAIGAALIQISFRRGKAAFDA